MPPDAHDATAFLARLRQRKQRLAWTLSATTLIATAAYFVAMTVGAPLLSRVVLGRNVTLAMATALLILLLAIATVIVHGRLASRIDALADVRRERSCTPSAR